MTYPALYYSPSTGQTYTTQEMSIRFGINTATISLEALNARGFYPVNQTTPTGDQKLYNATPVYTISGNYADQSWSYTPLPLATAKEAGSAEVKSTANSSLARLTCDCGYSTDLLTAVASQDPLARPARFQAELDEMTAISDQLDANLTAIDSATDVDEINDIVNPPPGIIFTGRGSGSGPEDLNVSYYTEWNSISLPESDSELYVPGTSTVIAYGSGGPGKFESSGNCFNPGDYLIQIRNSKTSFVIAEFEVPLNPAGEDVTF